MFTFPLAFSRRYGILMGGFYGKKGISVEKLSRNDHIDLYRHLAFSAVGGFFGCHAVLVHGGIMGNAQTVNLVTHTPRRCIWARWRCTSWAPC